MHIIPKAPRACILLREGHPPVEFASREAAFTVLRPLMLAGRFGTAFAPALYRTTWLGLSLRRDPITHVLIDVATWTPLSLSAFQDWLPARTPWHLRRYATWNGNGPVPFTGRRHLGSVYRSLRTLRSRAQAQCLDVEEPMGRPRAWKNLPTAWDDFARADFGQKNWKRYRRTQWR